MTTIVFVHAHPDDETTQTSGSMARASAEGDRVVVVYASASAFYEDSVRQLNDALDARRNRLADAQGGLPEEVAALIIVGSIAILSYATLVGSRSFWFHAIGASLIAVVISFSLVVLLGLSYPFSGGLEIAPTPFEEGILAG